MKKTKNKKEQWLELYTSNKTSLIQIKELKIRYENNSIYIKNGQEITEINMINNIEQAYS